MVPCAEALIFVPVCTAFSQGFSWLALILGFKARTWKKQKKVKRTVLLSISKVICCAVLQRFEIPVQPGDIVVLGSDGLWDNVFSEEVATIASRCKDKGETAEIAAQVICR
jgi:serine/threonine protein phosphatase PrpC